MARGHGLPFPARLQHLDVATYLPGDILTKVDRMSMAHSIEARVPLLDHTLVEFAAGLPASLAFGGGAGKHFFKRALVGMVPDAILTRPKKGFRSLSYGFVTASRVFGDTFGGARSLPASSIGRPGAFVQAVSPDVG